MLPYPKELRVRVVAAVEQGEFTHAEIARLFGVGVTFIKKMLRWQRAGQDWLRGRAGGPSPGYKRRSWRGCAPQSPSTPMPRSPNYKPR